MMRRKQERVAMHKTLSTMLSVVLLGVGALSWLGAPLWAGASSHREAPLTSKDPTIDNTDVYAFVSPDDASKVTLIANWIPFEEPGGGPNFYHFDDLARYLIKIDRDGDGVEDVTYEWTFQQQIVNGDTFLYNTGPITSINDSDFNYRQLYRVREIVRGGSTTTLGDNLVMPPDNIGPRSTPDYESLAAQAVHSFNGGIKEFTGQRDDPFFVDVQSIFDLLGLRPFNGAHAIKRSTEPGQDTTGGFNVHSTAIQVPRSRLAPDCSNSADDKKCVIGVWSTAERRSTIVRGTGTRTGSGDFVQVSRLGHPLVNEVVMNLELKDTFNAVAPSVDRTVPAVVKRVTNPELPELIKVLYPGIDVPPTPRNDLVSVFLTGVAGLNQQTGSVATPSEQLRLNTAIAPSAGICGGNVLGVIAGDLAGFPNGRRLEDDVVDIELRVVAGVLDPAYNKAPNNQLGDGVNKNDKSCLSSFPYVPTPHSGYEHDHHADGSTSAPSITARATDPGLAFPGASDQSDPANNKDEKEDQEARLTDEQRQQRERTNQSNKDDYYTEGDVVELCPADSDPACVYIANRDGNVKIILYGEAAKSAKSIKVGDYLELDGEKIHEQLFEASDVTIKHRR
jgi:hypothetical protein